MTRLLLLFVTCLAVAAVSARPQFTPLELDAKDADPSSAAFKAALAKATKEAREELGVSSSEELGVGGANLASLFGKRRRKRQLFGGESSSNAQSFGNALSTGAGIFGSALGIFFDSVWEAYRNFLRASETVGLLALDSKDDLLASAGEDDAQEATEAPSDPADNSLADDQNSFLVKRR